MKKRKAYEVNALLCINNPEGIKEATNSIIRVVEATSNTDVQVEALRTLAAIGKPPSEVSLTDCSFRVEK